LGTKKTAVSDDKPRLIIGKYQCVNASHLEKKTATSIVYCSCESWCKCRAQLFNSQTKSEI